MHRLALSFGLAAVFVLAAFAASEGRVPVLPETPYQYADIPLPAHLHGPANSINDNTPDDNPITDRGATLGRVLFYDTRLSLSETTSCASCHLQSHAFADTTARSTGFAGGHTDRNSMGLAFTRFYQRGRFFWDERAETLEQQVLMPIEDPVEMGATLDEVVERLEATSFYPGLFEDAFGTPEVTPERMARALAQFIRAMVAPNSRYDRARAEQGGTETGRSLPGFTADENRGLQLFFGEAVCSECHGSDFFITNRPFSNGLDRFPSDQGAGFGLFKVGTLRNVELTAPYMHDGRFATLEEVVEHYDSGIQPHGALFPNLRTATGGGIRMNLAPKDRAALVAFLKTLTDTSFTTDPRWSDPFAVAEDVNGKAK